MKWMRQVVVFVVVVYLLGLLIGGDGGFSEWLTVLVTALFAVSVLSNAQPSGKQGVDRAAKVERSVSRRVESGMSVAKSAVGRPVVREYCPAVRDELIPEFVIADVETTGFDPGCDYIAQIGAIRVRNGVVVDQYSRYIRIPISMPVAAGRVNGITDLLLSRQGVGEREAIAGFTEFAGALPVVAYNADFDYSFIATSCRVLGLSLPNDFYCALRLAREVWDFPSYKLIDVVRCLGISDKQDHEALSDCFLTFEVLKSAHALYQVKRDKELEREAELAVLSGPLPFDEPMPIIVFNRAVFTFIGCESSASLSAIAGLGALSSKNVTLKTSYLVLGAGAEGAWRYGPYIKQIDKAVAYRDERGLALSIVSERHFLLCLRVAMLPGRTPTREGSPQ